MSAWALLTTVAVASPSLELERRIDALLRGEGRIPALSDTIEAAKAALHLEPESEARGWSERARLRGWVPRVDLGAGTDRDLDVKRRDDDDETWGEALGFGGDVAFRWELGDVVFAAAELRVNRERLARASALRLAVDRVTKAYFRRLEVELSWLSEPTPQLVLEAARWDLVLVGLTEGVWEVKR